MLIRLRQFLSLSAVTKSGQILGRVVGFEFETETQTIQRYDVRRSFWKRKFFLIHREQVVAIEPGRLIVEDEILKESFVNSASFGQVITNEQPAVVAANKE